MRNQPYMPNNNAGIGLMLGAFATNIPGALATKYGVSTDAVSSVDQAYQVWMWFEQSLDIARGWSGSLTADRDALFTGAPGTFDPLPVVPKLPHKPQKPSPPAPADTDMEIEHDFFTFFSGLVSGIKHDQHYDPADGKLLGIEGTPIPPPSPTIVPVPQATIFTSGHPEVSCAKGVFQGFDVYLTRPGQTRRLLGFATARRYNVTEPLPAAGTAEVWVFEVQYHYQNAPFGLMSQPVSLTVRG